MTLPEINRWLAENAQSCTDAGISPDQAVLLCQWKLSDKVDDSKASFWFARRAFEYPHPAVD